ncbi:glycerate kinase [Weissella confusa]|uniref:Glycerate kinase n=1 Tax=Weissella confusa TaxID=1583 RepID=A0A923SP48_WEICO|nr:glycerate kinase [Weissella confusa]
MQSGISLVVEATEVVAKAANDLDENGQQIARGGAALATLHEIDMSNLDPRVAESEFLLASDVTNPLVGETGASAVFGPQKGATPAMEIEMSAASGIQFVTTETKNPLITTTYGTGQLIKDALDRGMRRFIIGLGGSATNDGGAGMAEALGVQ